MVECSPFAHAILDLNQSVDETNCHTPAAITPMPKMRHASVLHRAVNARSSIVRSVDHVYTFVFGDDTEYSFAAPRPDDLNQLSVEEGHIRGIISRDQLRRLVAARAVLTM